MNEDTDEEVRLLEMQRYPLRRILVFLPAILVCVIVAWLFLRGGYGLLRPESEHWTDRILSAAQKLLRDVPPPPGAVLVYERYGACWPWRQGSVYALYATDEPWELVWSYYKDKSASSGWSASCYDWQYVLECHNTTSVYDLRYLRLKVIPGSDRAGRRIPSDVIEGAGQFGATVYEVDFYFGLERSFSFESDPCPGLWDICSCQPWSFWQGTARGLQPVTLPPAPTVASYPMPLPSPPASYATPLSYP